MSIKEETKNLESSAITLEPQRGKKKKKKNLREQAEEVGKIPETHSFYENG